MLLEPTMVVIPPETYMNPKILLDDWNRFKNRNLVTHDFIEEHVRSKRIPARTYSIVSEEEDSIRELAYYKAVRKWYIEIQQEYNRQVEGYNEARKQEIIEKIRQTAIWKLKSGLPEPVLTDDDVEACLSKSSSKDSLASYFNLD